MFVPCPPRPLLLIFILLLTAVSSAQTVTVTADFDDDALGQRPSVAIGSPDRPSAIFGQATDFTVSEITGAAGSSTAAGRVVSVDVAAAGDYRLLDFDGLTNGGIITSGRVRVGFDFRSDPGTEGFAFLRNYDDADGNPESFADLGLAFSAAGVSVGPLDYDPVTGDYLGWPNTNFYAAGEWHRFETLVDLDANTIRLFVDGEDTGFVTGISRATGTGYRGSYLNWGAAFVGGCQVDNFRVEIPTVTGLPAPPAGFLELLNNVPDYGGTVIRVPGGDFRTPGLDWETYFNAQLINTPTYAGVTTYRLRVTDALDESDTRLFAAGRFPLLHNRTYEVSALIRTDFPRATWEISVGVNGAPLTGETALGIRYGGMPAKTEGPDGWERWTWRFVPHWDARYDHAEIALTFHEYGPGFDGDVTFEIADLAFVELPAAPLEPFAPGEGVTFAGGAGELPMGVEAARLENDAVVVTSTSAVYRFDRTAGTLTVDQRLDHPRTLTRLTDLPLTGLVISSLTPDVAVLVGDDITVGVQCDGNVVLSPHAPMAPELESVIGGDFNRVEAGDLVCRDDFGGFTASIHAPRGTGRRPRIVALTPGLPAVGLPADDLTSFAAAEPGWRARLPVEPGERLFVSASPSRPYDWAKSFDFEWGIADYNTDLDEYADPDFMTDWILWNFNQRGWAMSFGPDYVLRDDIAAPGHFNAVTAADKRWAAYFSQWFYYSRDPAEWAAAIGEWRDTYGMETMYSDGLAQDDWLSAYQAMRLLRENVFPDGNIIVHDSYPQSGVPSASLKPAIYAYATSTYMGENAVVPVGEDWAWARYAMSMHRGGNAFGVIKGDGWSLGDSVDKYLVGLVWGGRGRFDVAGYETRYRSALLALKDLWRTYGDDPYFFDRYYHPEAQELTGYFIGRAGMPIFSVDTLAAGEYDLGISSWSPGATVRYTTDDTEVTENSPVYNGTINVSQTVTIRARAYRGDLEESAEASIVLDNSVSVNPPVAVPAPLLFPNPVTDRAVLRLPGEGGNLTYVVRDVYGRILLRGTTTGERSELSLADLRPGVYWLGVGRRSVKFVRQ